MSNWSSYPKQQLLQESWRTFLTEQKVVDRAARLLLEELEKEAEKLEKEVDKVLTPEEEVGFIRQIGKEVGIGIELTGKFGAGIGALYGPISSILENSGLIITEKDVVLLLISAMSYMTTSPEAKILYKKIKEEGLEKPFGVVKEALQNIDVVINQFTKSILGTAMSLFDLFGYTSVFIPIINFITQIITHSDVNSSNLKQIFGGLALSTLGYSLKDKMKRMLKK